ncbi:unnamed protein product [Schistosoma mattheei]|uniref:F-box domain-containing protein n=1 Tax=Schistosoma mattheei TaxID=31246 RepID=A0AA85BPA5_9TREM|nr:unnamed protein product [Schistosoma mattheei]
MYIRIDEFDIEKKIQSFTTCPPYKLRSLSVRENSSEEGIKLERLPSECLTHVLTYINSPQDLETASLASSALASVVADKYFWKTLTLAHFDISQIPTVNYGLPGWHTRSPASIDDCDWNEPMSDCSKYTETIIFIQLS